MNEDFIRGLALGLNLASLFFCVLLGYWWPVMFGTVITTIPFVLNVMRKMRFSAQPRDEAGEE